MVLLQDYESLGQKGDIVEVTRIPRRIVGLFSNFIVSWICQEFHLPTKERSLCHRTEYSPVFITLCRE